MFKALPEDLRNEAAEKIEQFKDPTNHKSLKVHKLSGRLKERFGFSVNYKIRIIFSYLSTQPREAIFHAIGDHAIYQ